MFLCNFLEFDYALILKLPYFNIQIARAEDQASAIIPVLNSPVSGTSVGLIILLICSIDCKSGDKPEE